LIFEKSFHADRRTDVTKLIVAFRNLTNAPNKTKSKDVHRAGHHNILL